MELEEALVVVEEEELEAVEGVELVVVQDMVEALELEVV